MGNQSCKEIDLWSRAKSNTFIRYSEFHASCEAIIRQLPEKDGYNLGYTHLK